MKSASANADSISARNIHVGVRTNGRFAKAGKSGALYPPGSIGANQAKRNYVKYLVERYHHCREADFRFGRTERLQYSDLFKKIEARFKTPTYFIPEDRFEELAAYLQNRIDTTLLGRANAKRVIPNYQSFDEYAMPRPGAPVPG